MSLFYCFVSFCWWHLTFCLSELKSSARNSCTWSEKSQHPGANGAPQHRGSQGLSWHPPISTSWPLTCAIKVSAFCFLLFFFFRNTLIWKRYCGEAVSMATEKWILYFRPCWHAGESCHVTQCVQTNSPLIIFLCSLTSQKSRCCCYFLTFSSNHAVKKKVGAVIFSLQTDRVL